ncbi:hypothetical protein HGRIS_005848 [Hohenbuehelia grisea]|uniref:NADP-dependent oxidoreductase domain-containing protein n=1 Tax=Hohenbuehelia grisea TaxID=104357 RepID=A0ABR3JY18_9AGAR
MSATQGNLWPSAPSPPSKLGRYRVLSPHAAVHVSPIQLGAMSLGEEWEKIGMGAMNKEQSFKLLDAYYDNGGNFIDTANNYQNETSEMLIGEWAEKRKIRDELVIATKYTASYKIQNPDVRIKVNYVGNSKKNLYVSVEASLKKLRTSYIDILYVHWYDHTTSVEEMMDSLHHIVSQGKALYLGISDSPAWLVTKANQYARDHGKTPFIIYQGCWNVMERDFERDIIPMARHEGLALAPWGVLAAGRLRSDEEEQRRQETGEKGRLLPIYGPRWERTEQEIRVSRALEKVAGEVGTKHLSAVAIAYVMQKVPFVFPIVGGRKVEHLMANLEALEITLTPEQIASLESVVPFNAGFPNTMFGDGTQYNQFYAATAALDRQPPLQAIIPSKQ